MVALHAGKSTETSNGSTGDSVQVDQSAMTHFITAIQAIKGAVDSDKKMSPARRFAGYHMTMESRKRFGVSSENTNMTAQELARFIRSHFERLDLTRHFYDFLVLPDADMLDLLTFNIISDFKIITDTVGFSLSKLFSDKSAQSVASVFYKIDLFVEFLFHVYGSHFVYLKTMISDVIRPHVLSYTPAIIINQWVQVLSALFVPSPHASPESLVSSIENHALVWDCCHYQTSLFYTQCVTYTTRQMSETLAKYEQSMAAGQSLGSKLKNNPTKLSTTRNQQSQQTPNYSGLNGFCYQYLRNGECQRRKASKPCMYKVGTSMSPLKHEGEFVKLTPAAKDSLRSAFQTLTGLPCKV